MLCSAESLDTDVSTKPEIISLSLHRALVGLAGLRIVQMAVLGIVRARQVETGANLEVTERACSFGCVWI